MVSLFWVFFCNPEYHRRNLIVAIYELVANFFGMKIPVNI
jgi:hypothetical protein